MCTLSHPSAGAALEGLAEGSSVVVLDTEV